jgi:hypothetical protein
MGSTVPRYWHLILLHTHVRDGCQRWVTIREWPIEFAPYAPGYKPRLGKHRVSTRPFQKPLFLPFPEPIQEEKAQVESKKNMEAVKWKCGSVSAV